MIIKTFLEKAIEGWWRDDDYEVEENNEGVWVFNPDETLMHTEVLLDPLAWQAVGRVEGWNYCAHNTTEACNKCTPQWHSKMHGMIDALIEGKTIEEYIATL